MIGDKPAMMTVYHIEHGPTLTYTIDAESAVARFPNECSMEPWPSDEGEERGADPASISIPSDWRELSGPKRRALAIRLGASRSVKAHEADEMIEAEIMSRQPRQQEIAS